LVREYSSKASFKGNGVRKGMTQIPLVIPATDIKGQKNKEQLDRLLTSIAPAAEQYKTIVCFDSCDYSFPEYFMEKYSFIDSIENLGHRLNFTRNSNVGLRFCFEELKSGCFLVNQDCELTPEFHANVDQITTVDLSTPSSVQAIAGPARVNIETKELVYKREVIHTKIADSRFAFYCPWISYRCMEKIGYLDGVFRKTYSDTDYVLRALLAGLTVTTTNCPIFHEGSHISTEEGWQSASGTYDASDLTAEFKQFAYKWDIDLRRNT
jgi:GT2 family glycosyltransferase